MVVTFAGYDIKVGTPVVGRDGTEVGTVAATEGNDLVIDLKGGDRMAVGEQGVAAFEPDFVRLDQDSEWIMGGSWRGAGAGQFKGLVDTNKGMADTNASMDAANWTTDDRRTIDLYREDLIATKREVATGVVRISKRIVVHDEAIDVETYHEKIKINRMDADREADLDHLFEEESYEIELRSEEVDLGKRVRVIGQVELGKERVQRTERVTGQVRHEEIDVDESNYSMARPIGTEQVVADTSSRDYHMNGV
ncbi:YsnF/AvaK domain-containing protein [Gordonia sp. CPCC 205515]|uniref:YsnF/AvaK domain-containing protein n=1 Tax=Gordonia sp. CPCC 205515 TaxID=3140791 RepID=UPI003AF3FB92